MLMLKDARVVSTEKKKNTYLIIYAVTIILVWIIISMFIRTTKVDGTSMMPTLKNNDLLLTISSKYHEIKHGDIVAINSSATNCYIIKRVIAIDGDEIEITDDGKVYLHNELLKEP